MITRCWNPGIRGQFSNFTYITRMISVWKVWKWQSQLVEKIGLVVTRGHQRSKILDKSLKKSIFTLLAKILSFEKNYFFWWLLYRLDMITFRIFIQNFVGNKNLSSNLFDFEIPLNKLGICLEKVWSYLIFFLDKVKKTLKTFLSEFQE